MSLRLLFVCDPMETMLVDRDTTFALMLEAQQRGHVVHEAWLDMLSMRGAEPWCRAFPVTVQRAVQGQHFQRRGMERAPLASYDAIFMRKDPPMDGAYVTSLWLLDAVDRAHTQVINEPRGILAANEKLYALQFKDFIPPTLVTRSMEEVLAFFRDVGGDMIIKPLDGHAGAGVLRCIQGDRNLRSMMELLMQGGRSWVMAQRYLPEARQGDKRILLVNGTPVGALLRVPAEDDNRGNIHVGAQVQASSLSPRDVALCEALAPALRRDGLLLVGIDVIGGQLTEVNVTSPTGAQEIGRFDGTCPEGALLNLVQQRATAR